MRPALLAALSLCLGIALGQRLEKALEQPEQPAPDSANAATTQPKPVDLWEARVGRDLARRTPLACARGGPVILVLGQSNAGNFGGERFRSQRGALNWFDGRCYLADGPMLGADGPGGSVWPLVGDRLIASGRVRSVTFVVLALGATSSAHWADAQGLGALLERRLAQYKAAGLAISHAVWQQGESDFDTSPALYRARLEQVFGRVRAEYPGVRLLVAQTSLCSDRLHGQSRSELLQVQAELSGRTPGPDTDRIDAYGDRYDGCHFSGTGLRKLALAWVERLEATLP